MQSAEHLDWRGWCNVADAAIRAGRWPEAAAALQRAAALNPEEPAIARNLGAALSTLGRTEEALAAMERAVALDPGNVQDRLTCAQLLIDAGRKHEAAVEIDRATRDAFERMLNAKGPRPKDAREAAGGISADRVAEVRELGFLLDLRLDHLTTRMRRHAESLIILSGAAPGRAWRMPVSLTNVVRAAVSEVED